MEYFIPIKLANWNSIVQRYSSLEISSELYASTLSKNEHEWLESAIQNDLEKIVKRSVKIRFASMFFQGMHGARNIHVDGSKLDEHEKPANTTTWALNIPIVNCNQSVMSWYDGDYKLSVTTKPGGLPYLNVDWNSDPVEVASKIMFEPALVRVNIPHSVKNYSNQARMLLSIRFTPDLFFSDGQYWR